MKRAGLPKARFLATALLVIASEVFLLPTASHAATAGTGVCQQTYTVSSGSADVLVVESGGYCYIAFKNTGALNSQTVISWSRPSLVTSADVLVVGGGGGGGARHGGGGGAGGFVQSDGFAISSSSSIAIAVGAGGSGGSSASYSGTAGQNSYFKPTTGSTSGLTALGGGFGSSGASGGGGSSGGAGSGQSVASVTSQTQSTFAGVTLSGISFGSTGAAGAFDTNIAGDNNDYWAGGGGGGAGGAGSLPTSAGVTVTSFANYTNATARGGNGGDGKSVSWLSTSIASTLAVGQTSSSSVFFAGGGGGGIGVDGVAGGTGGLGGGATGTRTEASGNAGTAATGGGGGGSGFDDINKAGSTETVGAAPAGAGGSGVVVIRYAIPDTTAPVISNFSITSAPGADSIYGAGEILTATLGFSETVTVTGSPRIPIQGLTTKFLTYSSGSGTPTLTFTYVVTSGDVDRNGIAISADSLSLNSGSLTDSALNSATLSHVAISNTLSLQVDGSAPVAGTPQTSTNGSYITITYDETLSATAPTVGAFSVSVNGVSNSVSSVSISGQSIQLTLSFSVISTASVTLAYIDPTSGNDTNAIQDEAGNDAASITTTSVTNLSTSSSNTSASIALNPAAMTAVFRTVTTIRVSTNTAGRVDFYQSGKIIPSCRNIATSANVASCSWRPMVQSYVALTARFRPTGSGFTNSNSSTLTIFVTKRPGLR